jgi:acetoin:2,6-dichlorophenolindophenol oxidoreductase subunit beta
VADLTYRMAIADAMRVEMRRDPTVFIMGEDVRSPLWASAGLVDEFGPLRVLDTPISESGFVGAAVGAAMAGLRPIVDMTICSLMYCAMDQFVSQAAKNRYMFGGQVSIPVVYRAGMHYGKAASAQHSDRNYPMFMGVPGLKVVAPSTPADAKGLLASAIRDDNPVLFFEDTSLSARHGPVPDGEHLVPLGVADVKRAGTDVTIVGIAGAVAKALEAADQLDQIGIAAEVVDPRSLVPLDHATILASVAKTGFLVIADPAHMTCSAASEIAAIVAEHGFRSLKGPIIRVATPDVQVPFSPALERSLYPSADRIVVAARRLVTGAGAG